MKFTEKPAQWFIIALLMFTYTLPAQTHFTFTSNTGNNMTVLVRTSLQPTLNGASLAKGDEIGVFSATGLCTGAIVWNDSNAAITVWGDNELTTVPDGMSAINDTLHFRVWDISNSQEIIAMATYFSGSPVYTTDGVAILASFTAGGTTNTHFGYNLQIQKPMNSDVVTVYDIQGRVIFKSSCKAIDDVESILSNNKSRFSKSQHIISFGSNGVRQYRSIAVK